MGEHYFVRVELRIPAATRRDALDDAHCLLEHLPAGVGVQVLDATRDIPDD